MSLEQSIRRKLEDTFTPMSLEIVNESHKHSSGLGSESHFKVLLVSEAFASLSRVQRQRKVYELLSEELNGGVHALSLRLLTPQEAEASGEFSTPNCHSKKHN